MHMLKMNKIEIAVFIFFSVMLVVLIIASCIMAAVADKEIKKHR